MDIQVWLFVSYLFSHNHTMHDSSYISHNSFLNSRSKQKQPDLNTFCFSCGFPFFLLCSFTITDKLLLNPDNAYKVSIQPQQKEEKKMAEMKQQLTTRLIKFRASLAVADRNKFIVVIGLIYI